MVIDVRQSSVFVPELGHALESAHGLAHVARHHLPGRQKTVARAVRGQQGGRLTGRCVNRQVVYTVQHAHTHARTHSTIRAQTADRQCMMSGG